MTFTGNIIEGNQNTVIIMISRINNYNFNVEIATAVLNIETAICNLSQYCY